MRSNIGASTIQTNDHGALVDQAAALRDLAAGGAEEGAGVAGVARGEEHAVARVGAGGLGQAVALGVGEVLGDGAAELAVGADRDVGEATGAALLGPLLPGVELAPRLVGAARHDDRADVGGLEHPERGVGEVLGQIGQLDGEPQIGLVGAVAGHRLGVGEARDRPRDLVADELLPQRGGDGLAELDDVVLLDEAHLDVELGELGLPVGAEVLVAVAARDLVVALGAGHHQQLLEQLRALRQRVPGAGPQPRRHEEVAGALRAWSGSASGSRPRRSRARAGRCARCGWPRCAAAAPQRGRCGAGRGSGT